MQHQSAVPEVAKEKTLSWFSGTIIPNIMGERNWKANVFLKN
jgi:AMMECR1 domain-containing protein